jgi:predicted nucleotidyltransferase
MPDSALTEGERSFLLALNRRGVRFLVVGMSGALIQGARGATEDIDLWFERTDHDGIGEAAREVGGVWISGMFGMRPPALGGDVLGDRFDVVLYASGMRSFDEEYAESVTVEVEGVPLRILPLARILASKRSAGRPKDLAQIPALEEAILAASEGTKRD